MQRAFPLSLLLLVAPLGPACGKSGEAPSAPARDAGGRPAAKPESAPPGPPLPPHSVHGSAAQAIEALYAEAKPRVLGVGEVHLVSGGPQVRSALSRFTTDMLGRAATGATDLVVETWVADGRCGAKEEQVTTNVRTVTERPAHVVSEIEMLLRRGKELGLQPHVLTMKCSHYDDVRTDAGDVDYDKLLTLIGNELHATTERALVRKDAAVVVYGGSLHNDRVPNQGVEAYSYGAKLVSSLGGGYVELDLYVPELLAGDELMKSEPWYPLLAKHVASQGVMLIKRAESSYIMLLEPTKGAAQAPR